MGILSRQNLFHKDKERKAGWMQKGAHPCRGISNIEGTSSELDRLLSTPNGRAESGPSGTLGASVA